MKNYFLKNKIKNIRGFTLIEVMIAVALFTIIMIYGIGAVLSANSTHKKSQAQRTIIDEVNFAMEDMSRNLRLGTSYSCNPSITGLTQGSGGGILEAVQMTNFPLNDCLYGGGGGLQLAFESQDGDASKSEDQFVYAIFRSDPGDSNSPYRLYKSTDSGHIYFPITPAEIEIDGSASGFAVEGAGDITIDTIQPRVIIRISGKIVFKNIETPFNIETTVSQRLIDA